MTIELNNTTDAKKHIGHYEILRPLGQGGMGIVYLALDARLNRHVAIKCLHSNLYEQGYRERFKREALLLAKLNHPHIVHLYDVVESSEHLALVMEYVNGSNLQSHLREHVVPYSQRLKWLIQIAQGLALAHESGIIHRDLKSENILINSRNEAKISDLGIAKSHEFSATVTDYVAGSYCSMSPEQAKGETLDFRSDLFSFGILAYQLLCGCHPFGETDNKLQLMQRIIAHPPTAPNINNPNLPQAMVELLGQLLAKDPNNRPANTHWLAAQLEKLTHLQPEESFVSDDTLPLPVNNKANDTQASHNSAIKNITPAHPTFSQGYLQNPLSSPNTPANKKYSLSKLWQNHKTSAVFSLVTLLILSVITYWQLQPKPPKYIAVIPPTLTTTGMTEEQQELVKATVYDAIQQSVLQLNGYYLIPREEVDDIDGDNETIAKATSADELITTQLECKIETCNIVISRLTHSNSDSNHRMRVIKTQKSDVTTDDYLTIAHTLKNTTANIFNAQIHNIFESMQSKDYDIFIKTNLKYTSTGASQQLIEDLKKLNESAQKNSAIQTLYRDIYLDLYYETGNTAHLDAAEKSIYLKFYPTENDEHIYLLNVFHIYLAKKEYDLAQQSIQKMKSLRFPDIKVAYIEALLALEKNDYKKATNIINSAIKLKPTVNLYYNLALTYWYSGETDNAGENIKKALELAPSHYKLLRLNGLISMYQGDIQKAIKSFNLALEKNADNIADLSNIGLCYMLAKDYTKAESFFKKAIDIEPKQTALKINLADIKNLQGKEDEAEKIYLQTLDLTKEDETRESLTIKTQAFAHLKQYTKAIEALTKLQHLDPQGVDTSYTSSLVYTLAGEKNSALVHIENALKGNINHIWFAFPWFDSLCNSKQFSSLLSIYGDPDRCLNPEKNINAGLDMDDQQ